MRRKLRVQEVSELLVSEAVEGPGTSDPVGCVLVLVLGALTDEAEAEADLGGGVAVQKRRQSVQSIPCSLFLVVQVTKKKKKKKRLLGKKERKKERKM